MTDWTGEDRRAPASARPEPARIEPWHLKKEINLSLIAVLVGQLALGVWYVADFSAWRRQVTEKLADHDRMIADGAARTQDLTRELADRLARIETKIDTLTQRR